MAAKGNEAKELVFAKIKEIFGADVIGIYDKKLYVWAQDGNEKVQIAIALSCPKTPIGSTNEVLDFEHMDVSAVSSSAAPQTEVSQAELDEVANLMAKLGL